MGGRTVLREENATVLPFRDSTLRRPIDVVAWMNAHAPRQTEPTDAKDNVIALARSARRGRGRTWFGGPPDGDAA